VVRRLRGLRARRVQRAEGRRGWSLCGGPGKGKRGEADRGEEGGGARVVAGRLLDRDALARGRGKAGGRRGGGQDRGGRMITPGTDKKRKKSGRESVKTWPGYSEGRRGLLFQGGLPTVPSCAGRGPLNTSARKLRRGFPWERFWGEGAG